MILAAGLMLGACSNDNEPTADNANGVAAVFTTNLDNRVQTRMTDNVWGDNDAIGIFSLADEMDGVTVDGVDLSGNIATNLKYTRTNNGTDEAGWDGGSTAFRFKNPAIVTVNFKAYYPYKATDITADASTGKLVDGTIAVDASDQSANKQLEYDFLYSDTDSEGEKSSGSKDAPNVNFQFAHSMTKIIVKFVPDGESVTALPTDMKPSLIGLRTKGTFSLKNGQVTSDANSVATLSLTNKTAGSSTTEQTYIAIVPPQPASTSIQLSILANSDTDTYLTQTIIMSTELKAANSYTITLTVKKKELVVSGSNITPWTANDKAGSSDAILQ